MPDPSTMPVPPELEGLATHDPEVIEALRRARITLEQRSNLDEREMELIRIAALVALGAPEASFRAHVGRALSAGASPADIWGTVTSLATIVGVPRLLAAVPVIASVIDDD